MDEQRVREIAMSAVSRAEFWIALVALTIAILVAGGFPDRWTKHRIESLEQRIQQLESKQK